MYHLRPCEYVQRGGKQFGVITGVSDSFDLFFFLPFSLENNPPVPTLQTGHNPLHKFLGFNPSNYLLSMSARDHYDGREMPPNGQSHISVYTLRGVRKVCRFVLFKIYRLVYFDIVVSHWLAFAYPCMSTRYRLCSFRYSFYGSSIFSEKTYEEYRTFIRMAIQPPTI